MHHFNVHTTHLLTIGKSKNSSPLSRAAFCIILGDLRSDHFTILDGLALIFAVEVEVDFGVLNFPGAVLVLEETVFLEGNFTVGSLPPAILVLVDALSIEIYLGVLALPPAKFVLIDAVLLEGDFTVSGLPPAILVLVNALRLEVDLAVFNSPPTILVLVDAGMVRVDLAVGVVIPVAVFSGLIGQTGEFGLFCLGVCQSRGGGLALLPWCMSESWWWACNRRHRPSL